MGCSLYFNNNFGLKRRNLMGAIFVVLIYLALIAVLLCFLYIVLTNMNEEMFPKTNDKKRRLP